MRHLLTLFISFFLYLTSYAQPPCASNPPAGETCATATPICDLNGYCGNTNTYTPDAWGSTGSLLGCGFLGLSSCPGTGLLDAFCGSVENDSYLSFVADATTISFDVWITASSTGDGIQLIIFDTPACGDDLVNSYYCQQITPNGGTPTNVSASGLVPGNTYYIMIDGYAGDLADYIIGANAGISVPVTVTPAAASVCIGDVVNLTASGGDGTYTWDASSDLNTTTGANVTVTPPSTAGTYSYTVNSATGNPLCPSSTSSVAVITVTNCGCTVTASSSVVSAICEGNTFNLFATNVTGATSYSWTGPDGFTSNVQNPTGITATTTGGSYTVNVVSPSGNCSSTINVTVNPNLSSFENISICPGSNHTYPDGTVSNNITVNENYVSTITSVVTACDSVVTTNVTVITPSNSTEIVIICEGTDYTYPDGVQILNVTIDTSHVSTLVSSQGCDSTVTTSLIVTPVYNETENVEACENSTYTYPDGTTELISSNSSHVSNLNSVAGCDSIVTTILTMNPIQNTVENVSICTGSNHTYPDGTVSNNIIVDESYVSTIPSVVTSCDSIITTNITVIVSFNTSEAIDICDGADYTYPDGTSSLNITTDESHVSTLTSVQGCDSIVTTNLTISSTYNETENVEACENSTYFYPDGSSEVISTNSTHVSNLTSIVGCDSIVTTNVTMNPIQNMNENVTLCFGSNYTYPDGTVSNNIIVDESHTSTLMNTSGCDSIVVVNLNVLPELILNGLVADEDCGEANGSIDVSVTGGDSNYTYNWSPNGESTSSISNLNAGGYDITVTDGFGCTTTESYTVDMGSTIIITATPDNVTINEGDTVQLLASGADNYVWSPSYGLDCSNCPSPIANPNETITYIVTGTNSFGCSGTATVTIFVESISVIYSIPNIISLSSTSGNQMWFIKSEGIETYNCIIVNRWGNFIYESDDPSGSWDGTDKTGNKVGEGTYFYKISATGINGVEINKHGFIQVVH